MSPLPIQHADTIDAERRAFFRAGTGRRARAERLIEDLRTLPEPEQRRALAALRSRLPHRLDLDAARLVDAQRRYARLVSELIGAN